MPYGEVDISMSTPEQRVKCALTGDHKWIVIPLPMEKGPLEPTLAIHYMCTKCNVTKCYNIMSTELPDELDERQEQQRLFLGVEDG